MEVLSINMNKFGGLRPNGKGEIYNTAIAEQAKNIITDFLEVEQDNVVFVSETNNAKDNLELFEKLFDETKYTIHKPSSFESFRSHPYGCTVAITKENSPWKQSESIDLIDKNRVLYANKSVVLKRGDIILVGVHMPYEIGYWGEIINFFKENQGKRLYLIGDFNVCDDSERKAKLKELKKEGAIDVWVERGGDIGHVTCTTGRRLDYLLSSSAGWSSIKKMGYLDSLRKNGLTDHSGVFVEIERQE